MKEASYNRPHFLWFHLCEMYVTEKSLETQIRLVAHGWGEASANGYGVSFGDCESILNLYSCDCYTTLWVY